MNKFHVVVIALLLSPMAASAQPKTDFKFEFVKEAGGEGAILVAPETKYSKELGYGFDLGSVVRADGRGGCASSDKPFFFSVALPEGNYDVHLTLGDRVAESETKVLAESRRLMLDTIKTKIGERVMRKITVNIRDAHLPGGKQVKLKDREIKGPVSSPVLHWDEKLTLEFAGPKPCVSVIEIRKNTEAITVYLAGDSTVTDQTGGAYRGWGQILPRFFKAGGVAVANHAESGEATTSFIGARRFEKILTTLKKGDYLFVQFGHNDQNQKRPIAAYKDALKQYIAKARERGATPILVTPMQRRSFDADGKVRESLGGYPEAVREVAKEEKAVLIDLNAMSGKFYESLGPEKSKSAFVDNTHSNEYGAFEFARFIAESIRRDDSVLGKHVVDDVPAMPRPQ